MGAAGKLMIEENEGGPQRLGHFATTPGGTGGTPGGHIQMKKGPHSATFGHIRPHSASPSREDHSKILQKPTKSTPQHEGGSHIRRNRLSLL